MKFDPQGSVGEVDLVDTHEDVLGILEHLSLVTGVVLVMCSHADLGVSIGQYWLWGLM